MDDGHRLERGTAAGAQRRRLLAVLAITTVILGSEIAGGVLAHSLVLIADAGHMATDVAGIGLSLIAVSFAARPSSESRTFGYERAEILAALLNAVVLFGVGIFVLFEAARRLAHPGAPSTGLMTLFGVVALAGDGAGLMLLHRGHGESLTVRGAYLEIASDLLAGIAILVAAAVIAVTGFARADALASIFVGALILPRTVKLVRDAVDVLFEATPRDVDLSEVRHHIRSIAGVQEVHDLHAWTITSGHRVLSAHVVLSDRAWAERADDRVLDELDRCLGSHFDVEHCTFQLERSTHRSHERPTHP